MIMGNVQRLLQVAHILGVRTRGVFYISRMLRKNDICGKLSVIFTFWRHV